MKKNIILMLTLTLVLVGCDSGGTESQSQEQIEISQDEFNFDEYGNAIVELNNKANSTFEVAEQHVVMLANVWQDTKEGRKHSETKEYITFTDKSGHEAFYRSHLDSMKKYIENSTYEPDMQVITANRDEMQNEIREIREMTSEYPEMYEALKGKVDAAVVMVNLAESPSNTLSEYIENLKEAQKLYIQYDTDTQAEYNFIINR